MTDNIDNNENKDGSSKEALPKHQEEQISLEYIGQITSELSSLKKEINYANKALDTKVNEAGNKLSEGVNKLGSHISELGAILSEHDNKTKNFIKELETFTLLPEKLSDRIRATVPDIGAEVASIVIRSIDSVGEQFTKLMDKLDSSVQEYQGKLEASTTQQQVRLSAITSQITEQVFEHHQSRSKKFIISLSIMILFSAGISSVTSYLVTTKYPRYVEITGARDITIQDSRVNTFQQAGKVGDK